MAASDHVWVIEFLRHKLGLMWMAPKAETPNHEPSSQGRVETRRDESSLPPRGIPSMVNVLQRFLALEISATRRSLNAGWLGDSDVEDSAPRDSVPETIWNQTRRIVREMIAIQATRARTNWDPITYN
ncbi:MAG TPA: hypothetical protein VFX10_07805 [Nitrospira sp.]|nr:hypothetical protein [Nitrospira sp.]